MTRTAPTDLASLDELALFDELSLDRLRARRSAKWSAYPPDVLPAWVAEMDFPLAEPIARALRGAIDLDDCGYARPAELPGAFRAFAAARWGWEVDPSRVLAVPEVMIGAAEVLRLTTSPGDGVVVNPPIYPPFFSTIREVDRRVVEVPLLRGAAGWALDLDGLERAFSSGARAYLLCNPHNPTGRVFAPDELRAVAELAVRHDVVVLADEIHAPLTLPGAAHTPFVTVSEPLGARAVTLASASKGWNIPGLKCALLVAGSAAMRATLAPLALPERAERVGHLGVIGTVAALREGGAWLDALVRHLDRNRARLAALLAAELPAVRWVPPQAGYLAWLDCTALGLGDDPARTFLKRGRVALSRGPDFGREGAGFARLNMGTSGGILEEIVGRMRNSVEC
ncbi:MAG TPA: aminotransferase class I/II-fold pyridoxal phosphate-dependent enzyme [Gemmatimonadaceae bacterium]|nr:aminotransferase class I/II-fold pyridoxal phosphate-dependent enzyme [Gemmatimonadaceae bacterium]